MEIGKGIDYLRAAILVTQLPAGSRVMSQIKSEYSWDTKTAIMANIEYELRMMLYMWPNLKHKPNKKPEIIQPPKNEREKQAQRKKNLTVAGHEIVPMSRELLDKKLGIKH